LSCSIVGKQLQEASWKADGHRLEKLKTSKALPQLWELSFGSIERDSKLATKGTKRGQRLSFSVPFVPVVANLPWPFFKADFSPERPA
jgi:hypothetical protein